MYPDFSIALKNKGLEAHQLLDVLIENGVIVVPGAAFTKQGHFEGHARLSFSAVSVAQINVAVERLANLFG
jgi:DNA-binding transcriptional MocR family regulator